MDEVVMCCTDGDEPFGVCKRVATTTRDFSGNGEQDPCCDECAAFWDAMQQEFN